MTRFLRWLETPAVSIREVLGLSLKALFLLVLWGTIMFCVVWFFVRPHCPPGTASLEQNVEMFLSNFTEEFFFRTLWLALAVMFVGRSRVVWLALLLTFTGSLVWGYEHRVAFLEITTPNLATTLALCWHGVLGLIFNTLAIKCATKEDLLQLKPLGICTLVHFSYNLAIIPIAKVIISF
ncbi:MAG: hypothetical protein AAB389_03705 [Patescibacteria group bacterium]